MRSVRPTRARSWAGGLPRSRVHHLLHRPCKVLGADVGAGTPSIRILQTPHKPLGCGPEVEACATACGIEHDRLDTQGPSLQLEYAQLLKQLCGVRSEAIRQPWKRLGKPDEVLFFDRGELPRAPRSQSTRVRGAGRFQGDAGHPAYRAGEHCRRGFGGDNSPSVPALKADHVRAATA